MNQSNNMSYNNYNGEQEIDDCDDEYDNEYDDGEGNDQDDIDNIVDTFNLDLGDEYSFLEPVFQPINIGGYAFPLSSDSSLLFVCESPHTLSQKVGVNFTPSHYYAVISKGCDIILNLDHRHNQYFRDPAYSKMQEAANDENNIFSILDKVLWVIRETQSNSPITLTKYNPLYDEELVPTFHLSHMYAAGTSNNPLGGFSEADMYKIIIILKVFLEYVNKMSDTGVQIQPGITRVAVHCHQTLAPSALVLFIMSLLLNYKKIDMSEGVIKEVDILKYVSELLVYIDSTPNHNLGKPRIPSDNAMIHFFPQWKTGITLKTFHDHIHTINPKIFNVIATIGAKNYEHDLWKFH